MQYRVMRRSMVLIFLGFIAVLVMEAEGLDPHASLSQTLWVDDDDPTCGGFSPCYRTIQEAVAAAQPGDTIKVRPGTYRGPIVLNKNLVIAGESKETVIIRSSYEEDPRIENSSVIRILGAADVRIADLTILGQGSSNGISVSGQDSRVTINRSRLSGHLVAISMAERPFIPYVPITIPPAKSQLTIQGSDIVNNWLGIFMVADGSYPQHIEGNLLLNNGLEISGQGIVIINKNQIIADEQAGVGISLTGAVEATVRENTIQGEAVGITVRASVWARLEKNQIRANLLNGVIVRDSAHVLLTDNQIAGNGLNSNSLSIFPLFDPFFGFGGGMFFRPEGFGVVVGLATSVELTGNRIEDNLFGVGATQARDLTSNQFLIPQLIVQGNQIVENGWGVWLRGAEATLKDNEIAQNDVIALPIDTRLVAWLEFLFPASGVLVESGKPLLQSNRIMRNGVGVVLQGQSSPTLLSNQILNNSQYGIALYLRPCFDQLAAQLAFAGKVQGEANELSGNNQGDLCPPDYPWPPGFRK